MELHLVEEFKKEKHKRKLSHGEGTGSHTETNTLRSKLFSIATSAVNLAVRCIVQIGRVQRASAINAAEAPSVPDAVLADHLFGSIDSVSAATATLAWWSLDSRVWSSLAVDESWSAIGGYKGWGMAVTKALGPEKSAVARTTMDFPVGAIASQSRVQGTMAFSAVETFLVPHLQNESLRIKSIF